jgi:hypothetical protein
MSGATTRISLPAVLRRTCVVAARRPASWIAALVAAAVPLCALWWSLPPAPCFLAATLACLAAVGDVPTGLLPPGGSRGSREIAHWTVARGLWPLVGLCTGAFIAGRQAFIPAALAAAAGMAAAATYAISRSRGAKAADAAALVILSGGVATAASVMVPGSEGTRAGAAGLAWIGCGGLAWCWSAMHRRVGPLPTRSVTARRHRDGEFTAIDPLPSSGTMRQWLGRLAMLTVLAGMAAWLVTEPGGLEGAADAGNWTAALSRVLPWAAATAGWFLALAVPQALFQDGVGNAVHWRTLLRTAAAGERRGLRLGASRFAAGVLLTHAAVLGWPPLVAAVLSLPSATASVPPAAIVVGLVVSAGAVAAVVFCCVRLAVSRETTFAFLAAVASVLVMAAWHWHAAPLSLPPPRLPSLGISRP